MEHLSQRSRVMLLLLIPIFASPLGATVLDQIKPGVLGLELHGQLGAPYRVNEERGGWNEYFRCKKKGLSEITAWYTDEGFVRWVRLRLVNELPPEGARLLFDLHASRTLSEGHAFATCLLAGGRTEHYAGDGVHFFVHDGIVREIWLTGPDADLKAIKRQCQILYDPKPLIEDDAEPLTIRYEEEEEEFDPASAEIEPVFEETLPEVPQEPMRLLNIEHVWYTIEVGQNHTVVIKLHGRVKTRNLKGERILFCGGIRRAGSNDWFKAATGTPQEFRGSGGVFSPSKAGLVKYANSAWDTLTLTFPLDYMLEQDRRAGRHILALQSFCGELVSGCETECELTSLDNVGLTPDRTITVGAPWFEEDQVEGRGKGFWVKAPVQVVHGKGQTLTGRVTLCNGPGQRVRAVPAAQAYATAQGEFYSSSQVTVLDDDTRWEAFQIFVPYQAIDLPAGTTNRVTIRLQVFCGTVATIVEREHVIRMP